MVEKFGNDYPYFWVLDRRVHCSPSGRAGQGDGREKLLSAGEGSSSHVWENHCQKTGGGVGWGENPGEGVGGGRGAPPHRDQSKFSLWTVS